jgi:1,4-dihydroxy-2-naphthoyl-CoA synthase
MRELIEIIPHGEVVEVAFNRPEVYNAFDLETSPSILHDWQPMVQ